MRKERLITVAALLSAIPKGKRNAIHLETLANRLGLTPRDTKAVIKAVRHSQIICSGQCGYWLPETRKECESFIAMMDKQAKSRFSTVKHIRNELKRISDQIALDTTQNDLGVR